MKIGEAVSRLNRAQQSLPFKIIASVVLVVLAIAAISTYYVVVTLPGQKQAAQEVAAATQPPPDATNPDQKAPQLSKEEQSALEAAQRIYAELVSARTDPTSVAVGVLVLTGIAMVVVWLGLGLTYLALLLLAALVAYPLHFFGWSGISRLIMSILALTAAFVALMQGLRVLLSAPGPVFAIARNALTEATRMKISLVFIVILIFALAALPGFMDPTTPLRYRVQAFLQYGTGGSFWIIAILVLFFSAASVSFEQRDKQIWQTMTKPVASWQYILGKWMGVCALAAALLAVSCAGVFLFTEYLRQQPAAGETAYLTPGKGRLVTEDREILEEQVLAARESVQPLNPFDINDPEFIKGANAYIQDQRTRDPQFATDPAMFDKVVSDLYKSLVLQWRSIEPGYQKSYTFTGLAAAKAAGRPIHLRYKAQAGSNDPSQIYKITFVFGGVIYPFEEVTLDQMHTTPLMPGVINSSGDVVLEVHNGGIYQLPTGEPAMVANPTPITLPVEGLEITYRAGSYQANFMRVAFVLWVKLALLSIVAIAAATFLSFPVACLVAFSAFLMAEGTGFLTTSLEYYNANDDTGHVTLYKVAVRGIGLAVSSMFKTYSDLRPTGKLVDGRILTWASVAWGTIVLAIWSGLLYIAAVIAFRRRELATYSGQ